MVSIVKLIIRTEKFKLFLFLLLLLYKIKRKNKFVTHSKETNLIKVNKKRNLFFKRRYSNKILASKRLTIVCRRKKNLDKVKRNKVKKDAGNFFFKKFFYKTLLKSRKSLRPLLFLNNRTRQKKLTKILHKGTAKIYDSNENHENTLLNVFLKSHLFFSHSDILFFLNKAVVYVNGVISTCPSLLLRNGDCVQLPVARLYFSYIKFWKKFFKKKVSLFRYNSWKFFKTKTIKKKKKIKFKKRKNPKFVQALFLFKFNVPKFIEVDYLTLTIFFIKKLNAYTSSSYYINKLFSFKMYSLYNFKKLN